MSYADVAKNLKKNIQIITSTFEQYNLQILSVACKPCSEHDPDLQVFIELASIKGASIPDNLEVKINLYDAEGDLYLSSSCIVLADKFNGYDTIELVCADDSRALDIAEKGRLYVTRW